ncbi:DUF2306 domain-containing protein [Kangiella sp. TOML190]|uniref:DUF2306 domain-containing protein n=1 Tax=Kangiella sp. TOML190 TaxID=2931351 RepID=UPI00203C9FD6|nr:DUF2306 domain-containing protein [Kangiella sp. TOML190]
MENSKSNWLSADNCVKSSVIFWYIIATIGLWLFVAYLVLGYGGYAVSGDLKEWNNLSNGGILENDLIGNFSFATHILLAVIIIGGGPLQLIPALRNRYPSFHRWLGRAYLVSAFLTTLAGLYLIWLREQHLPVILQYAITLDGILIFCFGLLAWKYASAKKFVIHRRWALRTFMVASAVWFFRVGFFGWLMINQGPVGFDPETFSGPFVTFISFAQYLIPLAILELYFYAKDKATAAVKVITAVTIASFTLIMAIGIFAVSVIKWLPSI